MKIKQYQVDAFTSHVFAGNPAAVCPLDDWPDDTLLQSIAAENNLPETAFIVPMEEGYQLRWFTPTTEVDLCGHATLATAYVLFEMLGVTQPSVVFQTRSGPLSVERRGELLAMDFPIGRPEKCRAPKGLVAGLGKRPREVLAAADYIAVFDTEQEVREIIPDHGQLQQLGLRGVAVTAPGKQADFVSRFFAPKQGIPEDPVTGSVHCALAPYWSQRLHTNPLYARQASPRGGELVCEVGQERVTLLGRAVMFMAGEIHVRSANQTQSNLWDALGGARQIE